MSDESETIQGKERKKSKVEKKTESHVEVMSDKKSEYYSYSSGDNADKDKKESPKFKKKKVTKFDVTEPLQKHERKIEIIVQPSEPDTKSKIPFSPVDKDVRVEKKVHLPKTEQTLKETPLPKPKKFGKTEFEIDDYTKIHQTWKLRDSDTDEPIERKSYRETRPPTPPSRFSDDTSKPIIEFPDSEPEAIQDKRTMPTIYPKQEPIVRAQPPLKHVKIERPSSPILFQEPPPEEGFIPPPQSFSNAVGVESKKVTKIEDSSQFHKRFVQMEQTTRMIKLSGPTDLGHSFTSKVEKKMPRPKTEETPKFKLKETTLKEIPTFDKKPLPKLEPFPFSATPSHPKKERGPPPPTPKKFVKKELRESDYESDSDIHIKPKWHPPDSDADDILYGKVEVPKEVVKRSMKPKERTPTPPSVFDHKPPPIGEPMRPKVETVEIIKLRESSPEYIIPAEISLMEEKELAKLLATRQPSPPVSRRQHSPPLPPPGSPPIVGIIEPKTEDIFEKKISTETKSSPRPKKKSYREIIERTERKISDKEYKEERTYRTGKVEIVKTTVTELKPEELVQEHELQFDHEEVPILPAPLEFDKPRMKYEDVSNLELFTVEKPKLKIGKHPELSQPSKFVKREMHESVTDSDLEEKIPVLWKPPDSDVDEPTYSKVEVSLPKGRRPSQDYEKLPTPPTVFDRGPAESELLKLPMDKRPSEFKKVTVQRIQKHASETEIQIPKEIKPIQRHEDQERVKIYHEPVPKTEISYLRHEQPIVETKEKIGIKNISSKKRYDIDIDIVDVYDYASETESEKVYSDIGKYKSIPDLEPFPYIPGPQKPKREKGQPPPTPKKFIKGELKESDYESEYEGKIPPKWAPTDSEGDGISYRKVKAPEKSPLYTKPHENGRMPSPPSKFDHPPSFEGPPRPIVDLHDIPRRERRESLEEYSIPKFPKVEFKPFDLDEEVTRKSAFVQTTDTETDTEGLKDTLLKSSLNKKYAESTQKFVGEHFVDMNQTFRTKAQKFAEQLVTDVFAGSESGPQFPVKSMASEKIKVHTIGKAKEMEENELDVRQPQAYRDESRLSEFGSKHIDPDSGLIYFKYDFGYEFGIVLPGEAKKIVRSKSVPPGSQNGDIEIPVIHERSDDESVSSKRVKFDPKLSKESKQQIGRSASDLAQRKAQIRPSVCYLSDSEAETRLKKGLPYSIPKTVQPKFKPFGPPIPGLFRKSKKQIADQERGPENTLSSPFLVSTASSTVGVKPPTFITPLKDSITPDGDELRLECVLKGSLPSKVSWYKNGFLLKESYRCQPQFQNGVCRLTLLHPHSEDSGHYTCTVENPLGGDSVSTAVVISPGEAS